MTYSVRSATVRFGPTVALDDVTVEVPGGSVVAVVGGDGAGKSTLLRALAGEVSLDAGTVEAPPKQRLGYLPASSGSWAALTVAQNIDFVAGIYGLAGDELAARRAELLDRAALTPAAGRLAAQLSGGMRRKLGFVMAIVHRPDLLILDEPSTGVDPVSRIDLWRLASEAAASGAAVLMSTTYLDEAERAAHLVVLDRGRVLVQGSYDQVRADFAGVITRDRPARPGRMGLAPGPGPARVLARRGPFESAGRDHRRRARPGGHRHRALAGPPRRGSVMTGVLLRAGRVTRRFGAFTAVDDVSMQVHPGEVVGLLGANGAGKTTLIRMLLGLIAVTSGRVDLLGGPPDRERRRRLGYVPQGLGLYGDLTVRENLTFSARAYGTAEPALPPALTAYADVLVRELPLGAQRQVAFLAALAHSPEVLVLDEPTSGVDALARAALWDTIRAQAEGGAGVLVTTHYMQEAQQCDRLLLMSDGRLVAEGSEADIIGSTTAVAVRTGDWARAFAVLAAAGAPVMLAGRAIRVANADPAGLAEVLEAAGIEASLQPVPATISERMLMLSRQAQAS